MEGIPNNFQNTVPTTSASNSVGMRLNHSESITVDVASDPRDNIRSNSPACRSK